MPDGRILRGATAGAIAAGVWAAQEPLDIRVFGVEYSDLELLAKPFGGSRAIGLPIHLTNGVVFGGVYALVESKVRAPGLLKGLAAGLAEHVATWPTMRLLPGVGLWGNHRAFAQAVWRHALFGLVLGGVYERLSSGYADGTPA